MNDAWKALGPIAAVLAALVLHRIRQGDERYWTITSAYLLVVATLLAPLLPVLQVLWVEDSVWLVGVVGIASLLGFAGMAALLRLRGWLWWLLLLAPLVLLPATRWEAVRLLGGSLLVGGMVALGWQVMLITLGRDRSSAEELEQGIQTPPDFEFAQEAWYSEMLQRDLEIEF